MLAYNQFSGNTSLQSRGPRRLRPQGAQKIVILETDGMANQASGASTYNGGAYQSYYMIRPGDTVTASGTDPGTRRGQCRHEYLRTRLRHEQACPALPRRASRCSINCIAFGAVFEPTASGSEAASAVSFLQQLSTIGGTVFPSSSTDPTNGYKWCIGTLAERQTKLQQAFINILEDTVAVVLVK